MRLERAPVKMFRVSVFAAFEKAGFGESIGF